MNVLIMTDIEGISGIYTKEQVMEGASRAQEGRSYMTADINACADACKEAGVEKVYVRDCHGGSAFVKWDMISQSVDYVISGNMASDRFPSLPDCDAVILLGYHAMAGTNAAVLEHTMCSTGVQNYWINGIKVGETAIDAGIIGDSGKPVIMVSGDDKVCAEAAALLPGVVTCEVKCGVTCTGAFLLPPSKAHAAIRACTIQAVRNIGNVKPLVYEKPIIMRMEMIERGQLPSGYVKPYMKVIDGRTYEVTASSVEEALFRC